MKRFPFFDYVFMPNNSKKWRLRFYINGHKILSLPWNGNWCTNSKHRIYNPKTGQYNSQPVLFGRPSKLANRYLKGLKGIEIGGSSYCQFFLDTINVNFTDTSADSTVFSEKEYELTGECLKVDVVASGDDLPFEDNSWDFVLSSHVLEHFYDPIKALLEWKRVVRPGGFIFMIVPHKERTFDKDRERTTLQELIDRHNGPPPLVDDHGHHSVWITKDLLELCDYLKLKVVDYQDRDDKRGNGFAVVIQKHFT